MRLSLFLGLMFMLFSVNAQQYTFGIFGEPTGQLSILRDKKAPKYDSLKAIKANDINLSFGLEFGIKKDQFNTFNIRPGFYVQSFQLVRENLNFLDVVHPALGEIRDLSQASTKIAYMHHRFKYLGLQFEYVRDISPKTKNLPIKFGVGGGLGYYYLFEHDLRIRTEGFAIRNEFEHVLKDSLFFEARPHNLAVYGLFEISYLFQPTLQINAQAKIKAPLLTATSNDPRVYILSPAISIGLRKYL